MNIRNNMSIKELCINALISFGVSQDAANAVIGELLYESRKRISDKATYQTVLDVLGKFSDTEIMEIRQLFQTIGDEDVDTDAILFVICVYTQHC